MQSIQELMDRALVHIAEAASLAMLDQARVKYLGKAGELTAQLKLLGGLPPEDRKPFGQAVNTAKGQLEAAIEQRRAALERPEKPAGPDLDVTLPGRRRLPGRVHPITATAEIMKKILAGFGFSYDDYPDIESEYFNFDALNTPAWHPARDLHDTFYVGQGQLLRTHTTAFQARVMRASGGQTPIRAMTTGRCYRADDIDASHYPIFQQLDVFAVGSKLSMSDLRWTLT
jgi:phenylalanyl-tRNA synthetase alpha chain